jgi:ABC-type Mn2+/Zn2+ transport system permease subunit
VAGVLGAVLPSLALVVSFYLDLPVGPTAVALLAIAVLLAAFSHRATPRTRS